MFRRAIPEELRMNRAICLLSLGAWILCWLTARSVENNVLLENTLGILGWLALIVLLVASMLLGVRFESWKKKN